MGEIFTSRRGTKDDLLDRVDFLLQFSQGKKPEHGEDGNLYSLNVEETLIGVFDGCGGSGARQHSSVSNKTSAYLASRIVAGAVKNWFSDPGKEMSADTVKAYIHATLYDCFYSSAMASEPAPRMINKLSKTLPTTAAFAVCREEHGKIMVDCYWAGDSRLYLLDEDGLAQVSVDDLNVTDAMESLYIGGKMTNVVYLPKDEETGFVIHHSQLRLKKPGILFAATDGCFDYITSPMEFEYLLLKMLQQSRSVDEWEQTLKATIGKIAQDDSTMTAVAFDFGNFQNLQHCFASRTDYLYQSYIVKMSDCDKEGKTLLWNHYRSNYYRL